MTGQNVTAQITATEPVHIRADHQSLRKLGDWTTVGRFDVREHRGTVTLDLRSPRIEGADIQIQLDLDRSNLRLLVPDNAVIDYSGLRRMGRGKISDRTGATSPGGRGIIFSGEMRSSSIRVRRGGMAALSAMFTPEYVKDVVRANKEGRFSNLDDPGRPAGVPAE
jgi:hypothetical protein